MQTSLLYSRLLGILLAITVCLFDQVSKQYMLEAANTGLLPMDVNAWFRLVLAWNTGISFSMLRNVSPHMPLILTMVTSLIVIALFIWFCRTNERPVCMALALIMGGATGNILDRVRFGAVVDFLDVHYNRYHWPAFNAADSAICIGVVLLVWLSIVAPKASSAKEDV